MVYLETPFTRSGKKRTVKTSSHTEQTESCDIIFNNEFVIKIQPQSTKILMVF